MAWWLLSVWLAFISPPLSRGKLIIRHMPVAFMFCGGPSVAPQIIQNLTWRKNCVAMRELRAFRLNGFIVCRAGRSGFFSLSSISPPVKNKSRSVNSPPIPVFGLELMSRIKYETKKKGERKQKPTPHTHLHFGHLFALPTY